MTGVEVAGASAAAGSDAARPEPLLRARNVRVEYTLRDRRRLVAVDGVDLDVYPGETVGLVGESGCGKSSLARAILRLLPQTSGSIEFMGQEVIGLKGRALRRIRRHMQIIFQDPRGSLDPRMSIEEIIGEPLDVHGIATGAERSERIAAMMTEVGLNVSHLTRMPSQLSGGQQQRVGIARALITDPELVVCDEPISALDVSIQAQVINLLEDLQERFGAAYVFIAHNLAIVRHISDRVVIMYLGQVVEEGPADTVFDAPLHPYSQGLTASTLFPTVDARERLLEVDQLVQGELPSLLNPPTGCRYHTRCPFAQERCSQERPTLAEVPDARGHRVACHFWHEIQVGALVPRSNRSSSDTEADTGSAAG